MLVVLILGILAGVAVGVVLLQRRPTRKVSQNRYFSHTLGINDTTPPPVAEDEPSAT